MFRRFFRFTPYAGLLLDDEATDGGTPAPETVAETPPAAPEVTPEPAPGPWASDLETFFPDPEARAAADRYMREKVQPRMTQLEQQYAETEGARRLLADFNEDALGTFAAVAAEIDPALGERVGELIEAGFEPEEAAAVAEQESGQELDPRVASMVEEYELTKAQEAYASALEEVGIPEAERSFFHPFVVSSEGDFEAAKAAYDQWKTSAAETFGWTPPAPDAPTPPAALGTQTDTPPAPPVQKTYNSFDEALDDAIDDMKAARAAPTPVGTI